MSGALDQRRNGLGSVGAQDHETGAGQRRGKAAVQGQWSVDHDIPWARFDPAKVDPELLKIIKAASMVEFNARDYAAYLCNVFHDDPKVQDDVRNWAAEEVQHGEALGRWAMLADPDWDHGTHFDRFIAGFRPDIEVTESIRGSRAGEMVARCMVEVGTSSYTNGIRG